MEWNENGKMEKKSTVVEEYVTLFWCQFFCHFCKLVFDFFFFCVWFFAVVLLLHCFLCSEKEARSVFPVNNASFQLVISTLGFCFFSTCQISMYSTGRTGGILNSGAFLLILETSYISI